VILGVLAAAIISFFVWRRLRRNKPAQQL